MLLQPPGSGTPWPAGAVHDTLAAILRQAAYQRSLRESLWTRFWSWLWNWLERAVVGIREVPELRWIIIGAAIAIVVAIAARMLYTAGRFEREIARGLRPRGRDRGDPWLEAERAAAEARYTDAAHALYRAVLLALAGRGRIRVHRSKTHGDYVRELRAAGSPDQARLRAFGRRFDRAIFGEGGVDAASYGELLTLAEPLLERERAA